MKSISISILIILCLSLAELNLLQHIRPFGNRLNLLTLALIFFILFYRFSRAFPLIVLTGVLKDTLGTSVFGLHTAVFVAWGITANLLSKWLLKENLWVTTLYTFLMIVLVLSTSYILECILRNTSINFVSVFLQSIIPEGFINSIISPVLFKGLSRITR